MGMISKVKTILILGVCVVIIAIVCRCGIAGVVYFLFHPEEKIHIEIDSEISDKDKGFDIVGPVFLVKNVGDKTVTVKSDNGSVADATTEQQKNTLLHSNPDTLKCYVSHQGNGVFWWEYAGKEEYKIQVIISRFGIVLERRTLYFEQNFRTTQQSAVYDVKVK